MPDRVDLTYCVVNTNGRELLLLCLDAIEETAHEVLVLDNASSDGSADAVRARQQGNLRLIALEEPRGKAENDTRLLREAKGDYCLLLNEDSELQPGAAAALRQALEADPAAAVAGAQLLDPQGRPQPCAWRFPSVATAAAFAVGLSRLVVQSTGSAIRRVDWCQSSALLVRREAAEQVDYLDSVFFVYSDETDFQKRLADAGWHALHVPAARAVHHEQLTTDAGSASRRIVEFHRNRDLYVRKHHGPTAALGVRVLTAIGYALRLPRDPRRFALHARQALRPGRGEGIADAVRASLPRS
ncbi:MAG: glycosyltransferase [Thermoleophilaceae bacterium]|nr:glycosyltransferase [Thermoleophilaceae bacterium]